MRIFISWSGLRSRAVAESLHDWLPKVIQAVDPWLSSEDIDKGTRWLPEIVGSLASADIGIICLTADNLSAPWILFEAGALSKSIDRARVCTYLFDVSPTDVQFPLAMFQHTKAEREETKALVRSINKGISTGRLKERALNEAFDLWWPKLEERFDQVRKQPAIVAPKRSELDLLEEALSLLRAQRLSSARG